MKNKILVNINNIIYSKSDFAHKINPVDIDYLFKPDIKNTNIIKPNHPNKSAKSTLARNTEKSTNQMIFEFLHHWVNPPNYIPIKTSGSTGTQKTIQLEKEWMLHSAKQTCEYFGIRQEHQILLCMPASYIAGKMMLVRAIHSQCSLLCVEPSLNPFENIDEEIFFTALTPMQLHASLNSLKNKTNIKNILLGGGEIPYSLEKEAQNLPQNIYAGYGMTETSSHIALRRVNGPERSEHYHIIGNTKISTDKNDCLIIENPLLFNGVLKTTDMVQLCSPNSFIWLGRKDHVINTGGIKIHPEQIEKKLKPILDVEFIYAAYPDPSRGQVPVLIFQQDGLRDKQKEDILNKISDRLHKYEIPIKIFSIASFVKTPTGKINRKKSSILAFGADKTKN